VSAALYNFVVVEQSPGRRGPGECYSSAPVSATTGSRPSLGRLARTRTAGPESERRRRTADAARGPKDRLGRFDGTRLRCRFDRTGADAVRSLRQTRTAGPESGRRSLVRPADCCTLEPRHSRPSQPPGTAAWHSRGTAGAQQSGAARQAAVSAMQPPGTAAWHNCRHNRGTAGGCAGRLCLSQPPVTAVCLAHWEGHSSRLAATATT
jgi:hypothetical protein